MKLTKPKDVNTKVVHICSNGHRMPLLIVSPADKKPDSAGILWIHGGGYILGMKEMVYMSRAIDLVRKYHAVVVSPGYRLAFQSPYPAAMIDCYHALLYMKKHACELGIRSDQLMVGGESAGGGLCAAVCMAARDKGTVNVAYQMPLYPMLDNHDTSSSADNHGKIWNTRRNHFGWRMYLRKDASKNVSPYASPSRQTNYKGLPPAYTFVGNGEPFYDETLLYIHKLQGAGIEASVDVYDSDMHAFDMMKPDSKVSKEAIHRFEEHFEYAIGHYFAPQEEEENTNMKIEHIAMYVNDLEKVREFYETYFGAKSNDGYHNLKTDFRSYFLTFDDGSRLEIMNKPGMSDDIKDLARTGYIHMAFSVGSREKVDELTKRFREDGYLVISGPRVTGDGYYESCIMGIEDNQIEITI